MSPPKSKIHFFGGTILLFLSMADRDFGLFRYGERAEYAFTGYGLKQLKESFLPQFGRGDWCGGFAGFLKACSLVCSETGETNSYGLFNTQDRGRMFVGPGVPVYMGEIVGECSRNEDIVVNVCKKKHVTNMRAAGSDDALRLTPHSVLSLEQCLEFIADDELVEVTPKNIRMRKRILSKEQRMKIAAREIRE